MGEMMTISEDELREHLRASGDDLHPASLTALADDALRQARRGRRTARTAVALAAALFVAAAGVTASTLTTQSRQAGPASIAVVQHGPVKLLTPIRFFRVLSSSNGACKSGGYPIATAGLGFEPSCYYVDSAHAMSVSEVAQIEAVKTSAGSATIWEVSMTFLNPDKAAYQQLTAATATNFLQIAVVIDGKVVDAPAISGGPITTGRYTITGLNSQQAADNLVKQLTGN